MNGKSKKAAVVVLAALLIQNSVWVSAGETEIMIQEGIALQMDGVPAEQAEESAQEEVSDMVSESVPEAEPQIPMQTEEQEDSPEAEGNPQESSEEYQEPEVENASEQGDSEMVSDAEDVPEEELKEQETSGEQENCVLPGQEDGGNPDENRYQDVPEAERQNFCLEVSFEDGVSIPVQEMKGPEELTSGAVTHPVDYRQGMYIVTVPEGTKTLLLTVSGVKADEPLQLTKWNGYLIEYGEQWLLCPDDLVVDAEVIDEIVCKIELDQFQIRQEELTLEQQAVYGELKDNWNYGEIFLSGSGVSAVLLVEIKPEENPEEDSGSEAETETAGTSENGQTSEEETSVLLAETMELEETEEMAEDAELLAAASVDIKKIYKAAGNNLANSAVQYPPRIGSINGEWHILGLARSSQTVDASVYDKYRANVLRTVQECGGVLHEKKYTEYSRVILALTALGEDVTDVGGYNLLKPLSDYDQTIWQGINGPIWALIALDSHNYEIPTAEKGKTQTTRENLIACILSQELSKGGWAMSGAKADPDITGMAVQALAPYYSSNASVKGAVDRALARLSVLQNADGGYASWGQINSESCSQVIVALTAMGINPATDKRFVKNGKSVVDALAAYATADGSFCHILNNGADQMATEQAYYALTAYFRFLEGKASLYDMSDVALKSDHEKAASVETLIQALPSNITLEDKTQVQTVYDLYNGLNSTQKALIRKDSVDKLMAAVKQLEKLGASVETPAGGNDSDNPSPGSVSGNSSGSQKNESNSSDKTTGGSTKKVNLVSGSSKAGGTSVSGSTSSSGDKTKKEKEKNDGETEAKKSGATKSSETAENVLRDLEALFGSDEDREKLPDQAEEYTDAQISQILEIYRSFLKMKEEEQNKVKDSSWYQEYLTVLEKMREAYHYDEASGTDMRDNEEDVLPWYIQLEVNTGLVGEDCADSAKELMEGKGKVFTLSDIHLTDLLNGGEYQPEQVIRVCIPMVNTGEYESAAVIHVKDDGKIELLEGHLSGSSLEFDTDEFSMYGIVGFHGTLEDLMEETEEGQVFWIYLIPGGVSALLLVLMLLLRRKRGEG